METENQSEAHSLATWLENVSGGISAQKAASELRRLHARVVELETEAIKESHRLAEANLRAAQMESRHKQAAEIATAVTKELAAKSEKIQALEAMLASVGVSAQRVTHLAIDPIGKPSWDSHQWPQIVQDSSGNWFGVREGWTMRIAPSYKGDELWLLREDGEFLSHGECSQGWRTSLEKRPTSKPASVVLPEPDAWAAVYFSGKQAGKIYTTCDTKEQVEAYIHQVHQSNDSITLRAEPIYMRAAPQPQADAGDAEQPRLTVRLTSFPESNGKRNWTAMFVRAEPWDGLIGNAGGITIKHGELWNRVAYEAERARFLIGERDTEPYILDYIADIQTPDAWTGESLALSRQQRR